MNTRHSITPWNDPHAKTFRVHYLEQLTSRQEGERKPQGEGQRRANSMVSMLRSEEFLSSITPIIKEQQLAIREHRPREHSESEQEQIAKIQEELRLRIK